MNGDRLPHLEMDPEELRALAASPRFIEVWGEHFDECERCYQLFTAAVSEQPDEDVLPALRETLAAAQETALVPAARPAVLVLRADEKRSLIARPRRTAMLRWAAAASGATGLALLAGSWLIGRTPIAPGVVRAGPPYEVVRDASTARVVDAHGRLVASVPLPRWPGLLQDPSQLHHRLVDLQGDGRPRLVLAVASHAEHRVELRVHSLEAPERPERLTDLGGVVRAGSLPFTDEWSPVLLEKVELDGDDATVGEQSASQLVGRSRAPHVVADSVALVAHAGERPVGLEADDAPA